MIILFAPVVKDKMAVKPCGVPEVIGNVKQDNTTVDVRRIQTGTLGFLQQSYEEDNRKIPSHKSTHATYNAILMCENLSFAGQWWLPRELFQWPSLGVTHLEHQQTMVLEGYLSRFLVDRFGRYVKGLDAENLRLSAWKGEVLLKGLQLVPEALSESLDLPVDVKWGHVGLFHLSVPWGTLGSKPVRVTLEDVYILIAPLDTWGMDDMERQRRARYQKSRGVEWRLRKHMERKASLLQGSSKGEGGGATGGKGLWGRMLAKIIDNVQHLGNNDGITIVTIPYAMATKMFYALVPAPGAVRLRKTESQITVKNIHLRYEDELSLGGVDAGGNGVPRPLSAGITLRKLVVQTVDENWVPTYVRGESGAGKSGESGGGYVHKLATVDSLAVYCDGPNHFSPPPVPPDPSTSTTSTTRSTHPTETKGVSLSSSSRKDDNRSFLSVAQGNGDLEKMFRISLAEGQGWHDYVIIPVSPSFRLTIQRGGGGLLVGARCKVQAMFNEVGFVLSNAQITNINKMRSTLRDLERWEALYRHRPKHIIKDGPKAWWLFLVKCVSMPEKARKRPKLGWLDVVRLMRLRKTYVRLYTARARHQATPEEYQQFTRLDEQLTANEIVAFRLKAIAELEEEEALQAVVPLPLQPPRQTWSEWLWRRTPSGGAAAVGTATPQDTQGEDAAARAEFLNAFAPGVDLDGEEEVDPNRVLWDVEASLNEGALTLVNGKQPCLRIIFDLKAVLKKKRTDWHLELGLGALQAFGLEQEGGRPTTLLTRRTWRPNEAGGTGGMIQIGDFQIWKSGGITVEYRRVVDPATSAISLPRASVVGEAADSNGDGLEGGVGGGGAEMSPGDSEEVSSVVIVRLDFAPHQIIHSRICLEQVSSMLATRDMRLFTSAAQSRISRLQRATRSSFLSAIGRTRRLEVTADIHAPLLVLPDNTQKSSRACLLLLDLGHIAFRRDGARQGSKVDLSATDREVASCEPGVDTDLGGGFEEDHEHGDGFKTPNIARNDWRLDIAGVQVVVADSPSFFGETAGDKADGSRHPDTAIVEEFDLFVKIRTSTELATNNLLGVGLEANLPRLSFNLHSSAYQLLARLLKYELKASSPASRKSIHAAGSTTTSGLSHSDASLAASSSFSRPSPGAQRRHTLSVSAFRADHSDISDWEFAPSVSPSEFNGMGRSLVPGCDLSISTVLSSDLEPVTEIPGESGDLDHLGVGEKDGNSSIIIGGGGGAPRRRSFNLGRRRSSSGSGSFSRVTEEAVATELVKDNSNNQSASGDRSEDEVGSEMRGLDGSDEGEARNSDEVPVRPVGIAIEVRILAPMISVLLVHDDKVSSSSAVAQGVVVRDARTDSILQSSSLGANVELGARSEQARVGGTDGSSAPALSSDEDGGDRAVEGALLLLEIHGLEVNCRGSSGDRNGVDAGEGAGSIDEKSGEGSTMAYEAERPQFTLTIVSFCVHDRHQRVGKTFSYLLSSSAPSWNEQEAMCGNDTQRVERIRTPASAVAMVAGEAVEAAVRITYAVADGRGPSKTVASLAGVWANWNPETVAALSIFAYGMYGTKDNALETAEQVASEGEETLVGGEEDKSSPSAPHRSGAPLPSAGGKDLPASGDGDAGASPRSAVVVEIRQISLWLNKEVHGRRLLLLEASDSTVSISKSHGRSGGATTYDILLRSASVTDLGTRDSRWRTLVRPSCNPTLPPQEVRLTICQDSGDAEYPLSVSVNLQSCMVCYLNQTWMEIVDYVLYGVLGDGPWSPWLLQSDSKGGMEPRARDTRLASPAPLKKRRVSIEATNPEVKLPAGYGGEGWVAVLGKRLTATSSYAERRAGDNCDSVLELCQIWSVKLDGVDLRSSRCERQGRNRGYDPASNSEVVTKASVGTGLGSSVGETTVTTGCRLLEESSSVGAVSVEARWPAVPRIASPSQTSRYGPSTYVVVGEAPQLKARLHNQDYSLLWQMIVNNIAGEAPKCSDALDPVVACGSDGHQSGVAERKQLVEFPFESPSPVATTFDVKFSLPDVTMVASTSAVNGTMPAGGECLLSETGTVRSRLVTWRMRRFADFRTSNAVSIQEPHVTAAVNSGGIAKELFGREPDIPVSSLLAEVGPSASARTPYSYRDETVPDVDPARGSVTTSMEPGKGDVPSPSPHELRWCRRSWPDGGSANSLSVEGGGISLSKPGWSAWRRWAGIGSHSGSSPDDRAEVERETLYRGSTADVEPRGMSALSAEANDGVFVTELASCLDVELAGTYLILEPWECCSVGGETGETRISPTISVRASLKLKMTTAFFLDGHWAAELRAARSTPTVESSSDSTGLPDLIESTGGRGKQCPRTSIVSCEVSSLEAFSRPAKDRYSYPLHGYRPSTDSTVTARATPVHFTDGYPGVSHSPSPPAQWRIVLERTSGNVRYSFSPVYASSSAESSFVGVRRQRHLAGGRRQVTLRGWSSVRAVLRVSDVEAVARALSEDVKPQSTLDVGSDISSGVDVTSARSGSANQGSDGRIRARINTSGEKSPSTKSDKKTLAVPVALDVSASGAGVRVRLEDDSARHFLAPPRMTILPGGHRRHDSDIPDDWRTAHVGNPAGLSADGDMNSQAAYIDDDGEEDNSDKVCGLRKVVGGLGGNGSPVSCPPPQPIVEAFVGVWKMRYTSGEDSTGDGDVICTSDSVDAAGCGEEKEIGRRREGCTGVSMLLSMTSLRVIDLMQRVPCHEAFRVLLDVKPPPLSWQDWLEDDLDEDNCETKKGYLASSRVASDDSPVQSGGSSDMHPREDFRLGCARASALILEYREGQAQMTGHARPCNQTGEEREESMKEKVGGTSVPGACVSGGTVATKLSVELGPVTANWNPRTMVALWSARAALGAAARAGGRRADGESASDSDGEGVDPQSGADVDDTKTCSQQGSRARISRPSTEIRISAHHGVEVMCNKEREGRQLLGISARVLDLTVQSSSGQDKTVWKGSLGDLRARDPRLSNVLYSSLIEPASTDGNPVLLKFQFSRQQGKRLAANAAASEEGSYFTAGDVSPADPSLRSSSPSRWESSVLTLSISEAKIVYIQPFWLEAVDYLWEGVLSPVVWGGASQEQGATAWEFPKGEGVAKGGVDLEQRAPRGKAGVKPRGTRSSSEIHVTLAAPTVVVPGLLIDSQHLILQPSSLQYSTWTGGVDDRDVPPRIEDCSEGGPAARHMIVNAPGTKVFVSSGCQSRSETAGGYASSGSGATPLSRASSTRDSVIDAGGRDTQLHSPAHLADFKQDSWVVVDASSERREVERWHAFLGDPADVKATVTTIFPVAPASMASLKETAAAFTDPVDEQPCETIAESPGTEKYINDSFFGAAARSRSEAESGVKARVSLDSSVSRSSRGTQDDAGGEPVKGMPGEQDKVMRIRVYISRLDVALTSDARTVLTRSVGSNILAAGFMGEISENLPLALEDVFVADDDVLPATEVDSKSTAGAHGRDLGVPLRLSVAALPPSAPCSSIGTSVGSRFEGVASSVACGQCGTRFEEGLVARHRCAWCAGMVCRKCLHTTVSAGSVTAVTGHDGGTGRGEYERGAPGPSPRSSALVCGPCAAVAFPEFSVDPAAEVNFQYGDDGPVTAVDVAVEVPDIRVEFLPMEASSEVTAVPPAGISSGSDGNIALECESLELTYTRSAIRQSALEASVASLTVTDLTRGTAFPHLVSPAPSPTLGELRPPQMALNYYFAPNSEAKMQVSVNYLEAIIVPSIMRKLRGIATPVTSTVPPATPGDDMGHSPVQAREARMANSASSGRRYDKFSRSSRQASDHRVRNGSSHRGMHDIAALQMPTPDQVDTSQTPFTAKVTLLNPVLMLPQDETDWESNALFVQGLVMANYVRSPRQERTLYASRSNNSGAEARDTSLEIIKLESRLGQMCGGSGRGSASNSLHGGSRVPLGGLGQGAGAVDPITLSLHYSEVERPLHPMVRDLKCQVEEVSCQLTYQDMATLNAIFSGWSSQLAANKRSSNDSALAVEGEDSGRRGRAPQEASDLGHDREDDLGGDNDAVQQEYGRFYKVVFETAQLGFVLIKQDGVAVVEENSRYLGVGGPAAGPFPGDELVAVAGESISKLTYKGVIKTILESSRPITLVFRRALYECWWGREYALDLTSWDGHHLDGVFLVGGGAGDQAVVGSADAYRPRRRPGVPACIPPIRPRPGALVVSVNSTPVSHLTLAAVTTMLDKLEASKRREAAERMGGPYGSRGSARAGGGGDAHQMRRKIRLLMREVEIHGWSPNWRTEVQCPGVRVTVIDDREGRDMPLLRAEVGSLDMIHESGPGMARWASTIRRPSETTGNAPTSRPEVLDTSLSVSHTVAGCDAQVDYYNASGGRWEPLLERVVAQGAREIVLRRAANGPEAWGARVNPGAGDVGVGGETSSVVRLSCSEEDVKVNITHAALDVILRAIRDWQHSIKMPSDVHESGDSNVRSLRRIDSRNKSYTGAGVYPSRGDLVGSQPAIGVGRNAFEGPGASGEASAQQRYFPFLLQNRTGLPLEFWTHQDKMDSVSRFGREGTVVGGTADKAFSASSVDTGAPGRPRRHDSWFLSLRLMTESNSPDTGERSGSRRAMERNNGDGQQFLNLPLKETGRRFLQCILQTENVGESFERNGRQSRRLHRCDAVWEVSLENGRHKLVLRSAMEVVNRCGTWLDVRCSTDAFTSRGNPETRKKEIVGVVAPGGRLPLPLRWSHVEDIRLRPFQSHEQNYHSIVADGVSLLPSREMQNLDQRSQEPFSFPQYDRDPREDLPGSPRKQMTAYKFSDCSVLVPAARAGEDKQRLTMSVIPWVACNPSCDTTRATADAIPAPPKPLFLFLEGVESSDPTGGGAAGTDRHGFSSMMEGLRSSTSGSSPNAFGSHRRGSAELGPGPVRKMEMNREALSFRPLEVVVYASLSFRNLLCVGVGWRAVGARGDPGAKVAEGWLEPGEGAHVLEANTMSMAPSLSFKVPGFDWTHPRQVSPSELSRRDCLDRQREISVRGEVNPRREYGSGLVLETIPCRNLANQIFYLSVEAATPRMNSVLVTLFAGFWVRNLSGLPLTLGEPIPSGLSAMELQEERLAEQRDRNRRRSPSPTRQSLFDVLLSAVQAPHPVTEEVFELRIAVMRQDGGVASYDVRWCSAEGNPQPPCSQVRLPSDAWRWEGDWTIDFAGAVAPNAPGTLHGGWESCARKLRGGHYGSSCFSSSRGFTISDPVWRRRWYRRRVPCREQPSRLPGPAQNALTAAEHEVAARETKAKVGEVLDTSEWSGDVEKVSQDKPGSIKAVLPENPAAMSVIYQPAVSVLHHGSAGLEALGAVGERGRSSRAGVCVRVNGSAWSRPLNIAVQGAGGPFQVSGGRWPGLKRPAFSVPYAPGKRTPDHAGIRQLVTRSTKRAPGDKSGARSGYKGVWGEGQVGLYELAYDVRVAPAPWNRTRVITVTSRYTVMNRCDRVLVVRQYGSNVAMELEPGESRPLHWADASLEPMLSVTINARGEEDVEDALMDWSGPVGIGNIGTFPICIRPRPGGAALPADSLAAMTGLRGSSSPSSGSSNSSPLSSPPLEMEPMAVVGANCVLRVDVNIGKHAHARDGDQASKSGVGGDDTGGDDVSGYKRSSAVQVAFQEEVWGTGDRFPTYRLENHTSFRMFYGQVSATGPGDALPPGRSCLFGWDQPCPVDEKGQGVLNLSLVLAPEPLSSAEGKRLAKTLNIRRLGEKLMLNTRRGRVEVVVEPDGPTKVVRMYNSKVSSILSSPGGISASPFAVTARQLSVRVPDGYNIPGRSPQVTTPQYRSPSLSPTSTPRGTWGYIPSPTTASSSGLKRSITSPSAWGSGVTPRSRVGISPAQRLPPAGFPADIGSAAPEEATKFSPGGGPSTSSMGRRRVGDGREENNISLRELHVFCRAVRVSVVDGDFGEMVLGSLEGMSMSVAATAHEVDVKVELGSLQVDSHMPGTPFPVLLQPVRSGHGSSGKECVRLSLVAAPHVKNVTYIKLASLDVGEFDLRLDEGMVRWAQGLADRVLWRLVAERRADEMETWPLPEEAFCSQGTRVGSRTGRRAGGAPMRKGVDLAEKNSSGAADNGAKFVRRYLYLEVFQVSAIKIRLSLQRAKESIETVYVGIKPGQMLLDLIGRMDGAHIKLGPLIVHNATTTRSRLKMAARVHYERELKHQAFLALGSLEALGNPVGLLRGMGQGMQDFVKEPVMGLLKSVEGAAPEELMAGMARGAGSLLKHSVGGVANSVSLITGTVSHNLTTLAMDKEYKVKRAKRKEARGENKDLLDGIGSAGGSLARGLSDGVSGFIKNPLRGAEKDGFAGFAKGVGTGMLGLVMKPAVGVADAATDVLQGVKSTTDNIARMGQPSPSSTPASRSGYSNYYQYHSLSSRERTSSKFSSASSGDGGGGWMEGVRQVRPRRVLYGPEMALRPYVLEDARAASLLQLTRYRDEQYTAHLDLGPRNAKAGAPASNVVLLLTRSYVLVLLAPMGDVVLEERLDRVQVVEKTNEGVLLHLLTSQANPGLMGLPPTPSEDGDSFDSRRRQGRSQTRGITCSHNELKDRLYEAIETAVKNASRG